MSAKSIRGKLVILVLSIFVLLFLSCAWFLSLLNENEAKVRHVESLHNASSRTIENIERNLTSLLAAVEFGTQVRDTSGLQGRSDLWQKTISVDIRKLIANRSNFSSSRHVTLDSLEIGRKLFEHDLNTVNLWFLKNYGNALADSAFLSTIEARENEEVKPMIAQLKNISGSIFSTLRLLRENARNEMTRVLQEIHARNGRIFTSILISAILLTLILIAGAYWIIRSFMDSLKKPSHILENLVNGNTSVYVPPTEDEFESVVTAANRLSENLKHSSTFAQSIGEGNFNFDFKPVSDQDTLGNSLVQMREKLKSIAEADKKRNWSTEGLALFADFIRKGDDQKALSDTLIRELVKYTKSNQGGLFIINRDNDSDPYLELISCYAYERKKYLTKRIEIGDGLVGQCYLEGNPFHITDIPPDYVSITSGLGGASPNSLLIVPLKLNDVTEGVIELASFKKYESHEIEFVQRVGESIASAVATSRVTDQTKKMLSESQQASEEMRAQEEEMRQNMEEMQATQEALERQTNEMKKMQVSLELEKAMFHVLMDFLPDRITYKDTESRIIRVNKAKAERMNMTTEEFIGKTDYDFFNRDHAEKAMREEKAMIASGKPVIGTEERLVFSGTNEVGYVQSSRIPFRDEHKKIVGMVIITKDLTQFRGVQLALQDRETIINNLVKEMPVLHYKVNNEKIIYDAWGGKLGSVIPDASQFISKPLKDKFPEVYQCIQDNKEQEVCTDTLAGASSQITFKHYIFKDHTKEGFYLVYALKVE